MSYDAQAFSCDGFEVWVLVLDDRIVGVGFSDAPMTHSADTVGSVARTFGPLRVELRR